MVDDGGRGLEQDWEWNCPLYYPPISLTVAASMKPLATLTLGEMC